MQARPTRRDCSQNGVSGPITLSLAARRERCRDGRDTRGRGQEDQAEPTAEERAAEEMVRRAREQGLSLTGPDGLLKQLTKTVLETGRPCFSCPRCSGSSWFSAVLPRRPRQDSSLTSRARDHRDRRTYHHVKASVAAAVLFRRSCRSERAYPQPMRTLCRSNSTPG
jgi:hypothetical protein